MWLKIDKESLKRLTDESVEWVRFVQTDVRNNRWLKEPLKLFQPMGVRPANY